MKRLYVNTCQYSKSVLCCVCLTWVMQAPVMATVTATTLTVSWNCRNLEMLSYTFRPHMTALTMLEKLSSVRMMSDASFATSVPAMPCGLAAEHYGRTLLKCFMNILPGMLTVHIVQECKTLYHSKANICFLESRAIVCAISCYRDNLPLLQDGAVYNTFKTKIEIAQGKEQ